MLPPSWRQLTLPPLLTDAQLLKCTRRALACQSPPALLIVQFKYLVASMLLRPKFFSPACWIPCGRSHSAAISAALISAAHLSISLWMNSWRYSGDLRSGATKTEPNSFRRSSVAGALIAATVALWSFCTIVAGVPWGKTKENQAPASKLASPCSCADARFGRVGERFFVRTVNAADRRTGRFRSRPQDGPWRSRRVASRCHLRARTVSESMRAPILSLGATSSSIACMIEGTPAITITLPIPEARRPRHLVEDEIRALGDARHAQACLVHLGAGRLNPFVQDGERARIGVDRHTEGAVGGDVTVGCMIAFALNSIPDAVSPLKRPASYRAAARRPSCPGHARGSCGIAVVLGNRVYQALNFVGDTLKLRVRAEFAVHWLRRGAPAPRGTFLQTATKQMVRAPLRCFDIAPGLRSVLSQVPKPVVSRRLPCVDS